MGIKSVIYAITHLASGKQYIGSAINYVKRWRDHKWELRHNRHSNIHLQRAWNKYGEDAFEFTILEVVPDVNQLLEREQHWIDNLDVYASGYNRCPIAGSTLGRKLSDETRQKLRVLNSTPEMKAAHSERHKGKIVSLETRELQAAAKRGTKQSEETKRKRRETLKEVWRIKNGHKH